MPILPCFETEFVTVVLAIASLDSYGNKENKCQGELSNLNQTDCLQRCLFQHIFNISGLASKCAIKSSHDCACRSTLTDLVCSFKHC